MSVYKMPLICGAALFSTLIDVFIDMDLAAALYRPGITFLSSHQDITSMLIAKGPPKFTLLGGTKCKKA